MIEPETMDFFMTIYLGPKKSWLYIFMIGGNPEWIFFKWYVPIIFPL